MDKIIGFSMIPVQQKLYAVCCLDGEIKSIYRVIAIQSLCQEPRMDRDIKGNLTDEREPFDNLHVENMYLCADLDNGDMATGQWVRGDFIEILTQDEDYLRDPNAPLVYRGIPA